MQLLQNVNFTKILSLFICNAKPEFIKKLWPHDRPPGYKVLFSDLLNPKGLFIP